jgi:serine/threonine protein kinase
MGNGAHVAVRRNDAHGFLRQVSDDMMTPERWQQIKQVLGHALESDPAKRSAYLDQACAEDPALRVEVERLLAAEQNAGRDFLGSTATQQGSREGTSNSVKTRVGSRIGSYRIVESIGRGGMGTVYRAVRADDQYQKQVAIKLVHVGQDSSFIISRFRQERQILASLDHPNISRLLDGGTTEDAAPYFVMELIEGKPIDEYCDRHRLPTNERLKIFLQVCSAIQYAHQRMIIHRDIKPGNILVGDDGVPKLLDFGIAKLLHSSSSDDDTTMTAFRALTPGYASPEQIQNKPITTASDIYSLGVVLYELLTGRSPYRVTSRTPHELAQAVCEAEPDRPSTAVTRSAPSQMDPIPADITPAALSAVRDGTIYKLRKGLRGDLDNIVLMALRKEPERRYSSVEQFADDIRRHLNRLPVTASKGTASYRARKFISRHRAGAFAAATVALSLAVGLVITLREAHIARQQAAIALTERARAQTRFEDVRTLANSLIFEVHDSISNLPGSTPARKLIMERAVQYLDRLAKDASGDSTLQRDLAWAYHRIGQVQGDPNQGNMGETDAMLTSINKSAALFQEVATNNPNSIVDQLNAAFGHRLLATISPQADERRRQIDRAMKITDRLMQTDSANPKVKSERGIEYSVLAALQDENGDAPAAVESYRKCVSAREDLLRTNPEYPHAKQSLAMAKVQTAEELAQTGSRKEALQLNGRGIELYESVVTQETNNARARREFAMSIWRHGEIQMLDGDYAGALASYRKAMTIVQPMEQQDPENVMLHTDVGGSTVSIGKALVSSGRVKEGLILIEQGIRLLEQQLQTDPANAPGAVASSYMWKGDALMRLRNFPDAISSYGKAAAILETPQSIPSDKPHKAQLAYAYTKLGAALARTGRGREAETAYRKALQIAEPLNTGQEPDPRLAVILADTYFGLGNLVRKSGELATEKTVPRESWADACDSYGKSLSEWRKVPNPGAQSPFGFYLSNPTDAAKEKIRCDTSSAQREKTGGLQALSRTPAPHLS